MTTTATAGAQPRSQRRPLYLAFLPSAHLLASLLKRLPSGKNRSRLCYSHADDWEAKNSV
jgi:hypothetical protein